MKGYKLFKRKKGGQRGRMGKRGKTGKNVTYFPNFLALLQPGGITKKCMGFPLPPKKSDFRRTVGTLNLSLLAC